MKWLLAGLALGALAMLGYQTVQVHQLRAESAEFRAAADSASNAASEQLERLGERVAELDAELEAATAQREAATSSTDEAIAALYEEVPPSIRPYVGAVEMKLVLERAAHELERTKLEAKNAELERTLTAVTAAWRAEGRLAEKLQEQVDAQAGSSLPFGLDVGDAVAAGIGFLAGRASR